MIATCRVCGNYSRDKEVYGNRIRCPKCGTEWEFRKMPLFILSGCSGVGKTTTGLILQRKHPGYVVLDADMFYNIMPHETEADYYEQLEQMESLTKNIAQNGSPVLWTMAGNLDKINQTYHRRFFDDVWILALTASSREIRNRMEVGRGITDQTWIQSSVDYNEYFLTHRMIGDMPFEILDTEGKTAEEVAREVQKWMTSHMASRME
ncbi:MAG: hypothetical protein ACI4EG_16005 [Fusicatenibacter sp.]